MTGEAGTSELIVKKLEEFCDRFRHACWTGPFWLPPEESEPLAQHVGYSDGSPKWEVWMEKPGVPDSLDGPQGAPLRALLRFEETHIFNIDPAYLAQRLAGIVAGFEAHEALEFARFDGEYAVEPHGSAAELAATAALVGDYLRSTATRP